MGKFENEVREVLYDAVSKTMNVPVDSLTDETQLIADLGAKSVNIVHVINALEDEFEYQIDFMPFRRRKTLGEMVDFVVELEEY